MDEGCVIHPIAHIRSDFGGKFGIPRQSGLAPALRATVVFTPPYRNADALRGLEGYSHLWLIWQFSEEVGRAWSPTVRPPRLGGNARMGVFATRSPHRPNPLGLSCVTLEGIEQTGEGPVLHVGGADLLDGTPIYDLKPYLPYVDCRPEATGGFAAEPPAPRLRVSFPPKLLGQIPAEGREGLLAALALDPRPAYQRDPARVYGMSYGGRNVRFTVCGDELRVCAVEREEGQP